VLLKLGCGIIRYVYGIKFFGQVHLELGNASLKFKKCVVSDLKNGNVEGIWDVLLFM
jgi:hypothetical protein